MPPQPYNFFGMGPGQLQPQDPALLAQQMQLQEYNNPTSANSQPSSAPAIDPKMLAKMMMQGQQSGQPVASDGLQIGKLYNGGNPNDIPQNAQSYNLGAGPLPWQAQNTLPWSGGNG